MVLCAPVSSLPRILDLANIISGDCLQVALLFLVIRKKAYRHLVFLAAYIFALIPRELIWLWIAHSSHQYDRWAFYFYYISDGILYSLRLLLIVEIARRALREYPAVWYFSWRILIFIGVAFAAWGAHAAIPNAHSKRLLFLSLERSYSITQAVLLLLVLCIGLYYRVSVSHFFRLILAGICIYSAVQIVNTELGRYIPKPALSAFDFIDRYSFTAMLAVWVWALWKWTPSPHRPPQLISQTEYDDISPQVHDRLRELNNRLGGLRKKR